MRNLFQHFIYNGVPSDYYDVLAVFVNKDINGVNPAGMQTKATTQYAKRSNSFNIIQQSYDEPISFTVQLVNKDFSHMDKPRERDLKRWLCKRGEYHWMQLYEDGFEDLYMMANFSNPKFIYYSGVCGMEFEVMTNAPYMFSPPIKKKVEVTNAAKSINVYVDTDEDDYVYPSIKMVMKEAGTQSITNSSEVEHRKFELEHLVVNEVITIDSSLPDIVSSQNGHNIYKSFNKNWIRFVDGKNTLAFTKNCTFEMEYREIRKVGVFS